MFRLLYFSLATGTAMCGHLNLRKEKYELHNAKVGLAHLSSHRSTAVDVRCCRRCKVLAETATSRTLTGSPSPAARHTS
ncbi:hypothetical protein BC939DRAFT_138099 [Gamsiella multidivaricata]|uniref:uncharacterized protein n=1 Tax=Gamsiella multidivaricata TaxID=101098 RepID=UPI00222117FD|nr:uncharacterized protein BC939DRAFT_138099 [Gamsiella multidivaricata]KAI7824641.1 hypothetical protein BC939DRAFT_138099 [Gamsiella multidivaricata]